MASSSSTTFPFSTIVDCTTSSSSSSAAAPIAAIHPDILKAHILTRLDGPTLASTSRASTELSSVCSQQSLWSDLCFSTWPSTKSPRISHIISASPRSFFSSSFPLYLSSNSYSPNNTTPFPSELISAVDIYYKDELIFSRVVEMETESSWFRCSPFRIDMLDPKDTCQTAIPHPDNEEDHSALAEDLTLSWIVIDPSGERAMNLSSYKTLSVQKHWLSGEVHARFGLVLAGETKGRSTEFVHCGILVTCGGESQEGGMHVREVSLQMEDMDGTLLNGKDSLGILHSSFEGKKGTKGRTENEGKKRYERFLDMKRERKERKLRTESTLDVLSIIFSALVFASLGSLLFQG